MNISKRFDIHMTHMRRINDVLYRFEHFTIPGDNSAIYVYRREFSSENPSGRWVEVKVVRFWNEA